MARKKSGSYTRRDFTKLIALGEHIDAVVRLEDPVPALVDVFGRPYSKKSPWP